MTYYRHRLMAWTFVAFVLVCFIGMALLATAAATAQETPTPEPGNETVADEQIADQLHDLVIHEYDYSDRDDGPGEFTIEMTWDGRAPQSVTLVEMLELDSGGSTQISYQQLRLSPGERTEVTMDAEIRSGGTAAIMITTQQSIEENDALVIQDGDPTERPTITFRNVVFAMGLTSALTGAGAFVFVLRRKHSKEYGKERIA